MPAQHQPPADEAAEREKFEAWAKANTQLKLDRDIASYLSGTTQFAWMAWTERAAHGVKAIGLPERRQLPEREGSTYFRALGWNECLDEIAQRNAGVTTALPLNDERIEEIIASMMDNAGRVPMLKVHKALLAEAIAGVQAVCSRGCPATEACKAIRSGGECTRGVPAVPDCETCHGEGTIDERLGGYSFSNPAATCPDCDGTGEGPAGVSEVPPIPEGYVLVPVKPTPAMVEVMLDWGTKRSEWEMILRAANPPTDGVGGTDGR